MRYFLSFICAVAFFIFPASFGYAQTKQLQVGSGCWYTIVAIGTKRYSFFAQTKPQCEAKVRAQFPNSSAKCFKTKKCGGASGAGAVKLKKQKPKAKY